MTINVFITYFNTTKNTSFDAFENSILHTIDKIAPIKQKHIRDNHSPFMNKVIYKAIMTRTILGSIFLKEATPMNRLAYKKQRNYGSSNVSRPTDNKNFWRVVKQNFLNKIVATNRVTLRYGGKIICNTEKVADTFNNLFVNIESILKIDKDKQFLVETNDVFDAVLKVLRNIALILAFLPSEKR